MIYITVIRSIAKSAINFGVFNHQWLAGGTRVPQLTKMSIKSEQFGFIRSLNSISWLGISTYPMKIAAAIANQVNRKTEIYSHQLVAAQNID